MSDFDEYDVYDIPPEFYAILFPETAPLAPAPEPPPPHPAPQHPPFDEFDAYDFSEFTAEDFARIDAVLAAAAPPRDAPPETEAPAGGPRVAIELEGPTDCSAVVKDSAPSAPPPPPPPALPHATSKSPYGRFRSKRGFLTVSDLVGPAWCEVQFDYGLRQKRSRALKDRPKTFVTEQGNLITVDQQVAFTNNNTATRGKSVHKTLELEIHPEVVTVNPSIPEEYWALRLLNMLASVDVLMAEGRCREIPVFGLLNDHIVVGIIDELVRKPIPVPEPPSHLEAEQPDQRRKSLNKRSSPSTPSKSKPKKTCRSPSPTQAQITTFFSSNPPTPKREQANGSADVRAPSEPIQPSTPRVSTISLPDVPTSPAPTFRLHMSDTKTRRNRRLPADPDTLQSRLQLMLYHRLLTPLLMPAAQPFDFSALWARAGVDPARPLTPAFMLQAGLLLPPAPGAPGTTCLHDLAAAWTHTAHALAVDAVDDTLTLVYRAQPRARTPAGAQTHPEQEARDLARALEASLNAAPPAEPRGGRVRGCGRGAGAPEDAQRPPDRTGVPAAGAEAEADVGMEDGLSEGEGEEAPLSMAELEARAGVLGTKTFAVDAGLLDGHLAGVLEWWHGVRAPRGVGVDATGRCQSCEYRDGCEWRYEKAREAVKRTRAAARA
ncbi:exonuclease V [Amylocystis lapponica]|nr:exonuclease V [Amylocystis lapponica]